VMKFRGAGQGPLALVAEPRLVHLRRCPARPHQVPVLAGRIPALGTIRGTMVHWICPKAGFFPDLPCAGRTMVLSVYQRSHKHHGPAHRQG
jgi:hypothetical protein